MRRIAQLLHERNAIDEEIAAITHRPMTSGHLGEWLAAQIFDIQLEQTAVAAGIDGVFHSGPLQGRTVNIKWYLKREGLWTPANPPGSSITWSSPGRRQRRHRHGALPGRGELTRSSCSTRASFTPNRSSAV